MPSIEGAAKPEATPPARDLRDRWAFRVLAIVLVLVAAGFAARSCASSGDVEQEEAITVAADQLEFEPECYQVRFYRSGVQSTPIWAVSLWTLDRAGEFDRIAVVQVNADTGDVIDVDQSANSPYTNAQCKAPFPPA